VRDPRTPLAPVEVSHRSGERRPSLIKWCRGVALLVPREADPSVDRAELAALATVSSTSQGPGWWLASDGRWYPPEMRAGYQPSPQSTMNAGTEYSTQSIPRLAQADRRQTSRAIILLVAGSTCAVLGLVLFVVFATEGLLDSAVYKAPTHVDIGFNASTYYVFEQTGSRFSVPGFSYTHTEFPTLEPGQVHVVSTTGQPVGTWSASGNETITKGSQIYSNAVGFDVPAPGDYSVTIASKSPIAVIIAPSLGDQFLAAAPWLILLGIGSPVAIAGLVLLIRASNRRKRGSVLGSHA
jgi:hypothetical protein